MNGSVLPFPSGRRNGTTLPLDADLAPVITRLKELAVQSADAMLGEGPVHPDHVLLDLCADALHLFHAAGARRERWNADPGAIPLPGTSARAEWDRRWEEVQAPGKQAVQLLRRAKKIKATTGAGVFAKALIVRASATGAKELAMTLAEDLIDCPGLRASLWPAETQA